MTFYSAYDAYIPMVPSPLNPHAIRRRKQFTSFRGGRTPLSPAEKLLRRKAAEAWRSETMHRAAEEHERLVAEAVMIKKAAEPQMLQPAVIATGLKAPQRAKLEERPAETISCDEDWGLEWYVTTTTGWTQRQQQQQLLLSHYGYLMRLPDLSFLAPSRLVKSLQFWRVFSPKKVRDLLRGSRTSMA